MYAVVFDGVKAAVNECAPTARVLLVKEAVPPDTVTGEPSAAP
jgi:hypothetical protein